MQQDASLAEDIENMIIEILTMDEFSEEQKFILLGQALKIIRDEAKIEIT